MKNDKKIFQAVLIKRLSKRLNYPLGVNHFAVLMSGWMKKKPDQAPSVATLRVRKNRDGHVWLKPSEVADLSVYAGYDLTTD